MTVVQRLLDVVYPNMEAFRKKKEVVDTQRRKATDKIVASVFTNNKWHAHGVYPEYVIIRIVW